MMARLLAVGLLMIGKAPEFKAAVLNEAVEQLPLVSF
jgi:hypothetical protein